MFFPLLVRQVLRVLGVPVVLASLRTHLAVGARLLENSAVWKEEAEAELVGLVSFECLRSAGSGTATSGSSGATQAELTGAARTRGSAGGGWRFKPRLTQTSNCFFFLNAM